MLENYCVFEVNSPEYGECLLEVLDYNFYKLYKLISRNRLYTYAIGEDSDLDVVDCKKYEDDTYIYLTSYFEVPMKTVRIEKRSIIKI